MKDFTRTNQLLEGLVSEYPSEILSGVSNAVTRVGQRVYNGINEYSMLYAQQQLLKYDADGNPDDVTTTERQSIAEAALANCKREGMELISAYRKQLDQLPVVSSEVTVSAGVSTTPRDLWFASFTLRNTLTAQSVSGVVGALIMGYRVGPDCGVIFKYVEKEFARDEAIDFSSETPHAANPLFKMFTTSYIGVCAGGSSSSLYRNRPTLTIPCSMSVTIGTIVSQVTGVTLVRHPTPDDDGWFLFRPAIMAMAVGGDVGAVCATTSVRIFDLLPLNGGTFTVDDVRQALGNTALSYRWCINVSTTSAAAAIGSQATTFEPFAIDQDGGVSGIINTQHTTTVSLDGHAIPDQSEAMLAIINSL